MYMLLIIEKFLKFQKMWSSLQYLCFASLSFIHEYQQHIKLCSGGHTADPEVPPGPGDVCDGGGRREFYVLDLSPAEVCGHGAWRPQPQGGQCPVIQVFYQGGREVS